MITGFKYKNFTIVKVSCTDMFGKPTKPMYDIYKNGFRWGIANTLSGAIHFIEHFYDEYDSYF